MDNQDNINIRKNIHSVKNALGLTLKNIGASTGVTDATVSRYISGVMEITDEWAEKFCGAYHVDIEWLRSGSGEPVFTGQVDEAVTKDASDAGKRLVEMRHELGLLQKDVREVLNLTHTAYSRIENGHARLTEENAQKIEDEYGIGSEWLLYGDEEKKKYPVGRRMIKWLWENEEERMRIWKLMREE